MMSSVMCGAVRAFGVVIGAGLLIGLGACGGETTEAPSETSSQARPQSRADSILARMPRPDDTLTNTMTIVEPVRKYGVESGVVEYENRRLGRRQTFYFADFGASEAVYLDESDGDSVGVPFDVSIYTGEWRFDYNRRERTGIAKRQPNAPGALLGLVPDLSTQQITPIGARLIAGREASGVSYGRRGSRVWMWKGIPLRLELPIRTGADTLMLEAVDVSVDRTIPPERFQVPRDVTISRLK